MNELQYNNNFNINQYPINEETFWGMVDKIQWYEHTRLNVAEALEYMSNYLTEYYTVDNIAELQRIEVSKRIEMEDFIKEHIVDGFHLDNEEIIDLASFIVGMGRTMFAYVKDNPSIILTLQDDKIACFEDGFDKAIYAINLAD